MIRKDFPPVAFTPIERSWPEPTFYNVLVASVGYEQRATYILEDPDFRFGDVWAIEYNQNRVLHYERNRNKFESAGRLFEDLGQELDVSLCDAMRDAQKASSEAQRVLGVESSLFRVAVDISCMNRDRMAQVTSSVLSSCEEPVEVDFLYAPAMYSEDIVGSEGSVVVNRPILGLEGWTVDPNQPVTLLIGAGFESRLAMAAIETLEPANTVWLFPRGLDPRYDELVEKRNYDNAVSVMDHVAYCDLGAPYRLLSDLRRPQKDCWIILA